VPSDGAKDGPQWRPLGAKPQLLPRGRRLFQIANGEIRAPLDALCLLAKMVIGGRGPSWSTAVNETVNELPSPADRHDSSDSVPATLYGHRQLRHGQRRRFYVCVKGQSGVSATMIASVGADSKADSAIVHDADPDHEP
jgi:hypothetical protein